MKFLFFIFVVDIRVSGVGVLLCFVGNVFFVSDTGKRVLRTLSRPTRTGGYKFYTSDEENNVANTMTSKEQKNDVKIMQNEAKTV